MTVTSHVRRFSETLNGPRAPLVESYWLYLFNTHATQKEMLVKLTSSVTLQKRRKSYSLLKTCMIVIFGWTVPLIDSLSDSSASLKTCLLCSPTYWPTNKTFGFHWDSIQIHWEATYFFSNVCLILIFYLLCYHFMSNERVGLHTGKI